MRFTNRMLEGEPRARRDIEEVSMFADYRDVGMIAAVEILMAL